MQDSFIVFVLVAAVLAMLGGLPPACRDAQAHPTRPSNAAGCWSRTARSHKEGESSWRAVAPTLSGSGTSGVAHQLCDPVENLARRTDAIAVAQLLNDHLVDLALGSVLSLNLGVD